MKPRVKINGRSPYGEWEPGDTGVVDGYCRGRDNTPCAVVILDKNFHFVMVNLEQLEQIEIMAKYNITLDDKVIETVYSYREACEIAEELDNQPVNFWKTVDIVRID